ncbi:MAG: PDZ domain-containing protein [Candidatus Cloacimonetes bacterium]|nr:PDZ domain-containing protein [Candidatus Cloacimonadota bacterium]MDY0171450.1 PDZ domain-containing protein [Candidatus Cloacimonadaceae bacterium]
MKKFTYILLVLVAFSLTLTAQEATNAEMRGSIAKDADTPMLINESILGESDDAAYFGLYLEDLTFPKAQELSYPHTYGVLITGVVKDSPSWHYRLRQDDIIMQIGGRQTTNNATMDKILQSFRAGDQVSIAIFRDGKVESLDMTLGSRSSSITTSTSPIKVQKKKLSPGYGGGSWIPMWVHLDMVDINDLITDSTLGFNKTRENGVLQQGLGGKLSIGKGFFLGGQVTTYSDIKKKTNASDGTYHIWLKQQNMMGGVTLDRRIPITQNFISSVGLMVGGANHELEFLNTDSNYDWNDLPNTIASSNNTHFRLKKNYLVVQPRVELMYRFLPWLGLRAEAGYAYGYPLTQDWRVQGLENESYEVTNSPDTKYEGLTLSIGPWFGF